MADVRIELICPGCSEQFLVLADLQGEVVDCPYCHGWVNVPEVGRPFNGLEGGDNGLDAYSRENARQQELGARQQEEAQRQLDLGSKQIDQAQHALDRRDLQNSRYDELLERMGAVIGRWEGLADRVDRALERLERG